VVRVKHLRLANGASPAGTTRMSTIPLGCYIFIDWGDCDNIDQCAFDFSDCNHDDICLIDY